MASRSWRWSSSPRLPKSYLGLSSAAGGFVNFTSNAELGKSIWGRAEREGTLGTWGFGGGTCPWSARGDVSLECRDVSLECQDLPPECPNMPLECQEVPLGCPWDARPYLQDDTVGLVEVWGARPGPGVVLSRRPQAQELPPAGQDPGGAQRVALGDTAGARGMAKGGTGGHSAGARGWHHCWS